MFLALGSVPVKGFSIVLVYVVVVCQLRIFGLLSYFKHIFNVSSLFYYLLALLI